MWLIVLILIIAFFVMAGFFSGIETGLISVDRFKLEKDARSNQKKKKILTFLENPDRMFGTTLFGTNISIVIISSLSMYLLHYLSRENNISIPEQTWTLIIAGLILIFAEIIPKAVYRENPNLLVPKYFSLLNFFSLVLKPFVKFVAFLNNFLARIFRLPGKTGYHLLTREDISFMLSATENDGLLQEHQREMLEEALEFTELKAENVMIHRTEIVALQQDMPIEDVILLAKEKGFTRFPVYGEDLDDIVGILIIYDLIKKPDLKNQKARNFIREAYFAPETMDVDTLLAEMQKRKRSMAIIVDSYGGTAGLVTIEDILEELVGEIEDEFDTSGQEVEQVDENTYLLQGFVEIDYLNDEYGMELPEGDYETIAGLIIDQMARIPARGSLLKIGDWEITTLQVTSTKIIKVQISKVNQAGS
ncbi:MAG: HlyC/CorC family transporter [Candidatus Cloacimonetes bacterium]|nr:HlyC/CorC family transporter [Candidatus Cloacimonadota bacterium]